MFQTNIILAQDQINCLHNTKKELLEKRLRWWDSDPGHVFDFHEQEDIYLSICLSVGPVSETSKRVHYWVVFV